MFTGIVEERGIVEKIERKGNGYLLQIGCKKVLEDTKPGDSISTNGVCLTVSKLTSNSFTADCMKQTVEMTALSQLKKGDKVNLERALKVGGRIGGHFVLGHIDGVGIVRDLKKSSLDTVLTISCDKKISDTLVSQGSIALDGVSLTISKLLGNSEFQVSLIPTTLNETGLNDLRMGNKINIETDILGKYALKAQKKTLSEEFFKENGF